MIAPAKKKRRRVATTSAPTRRPIGCGTRSAAPFAASKREEEAAADEEELQCGLAASRQITPLIVISDDN
jgi:hypothetical protein